MPNVLQRAKPDPGRFNRDADLPYELRLEDFQLAMQDLYDLLFDINTTLVGKDLPRIEETVRPAIFSGSLSDILTAALAKHSRVLTTNAFHNGHPDLIPRGRFPNDRVQSGDAGVEVKTTNSGPSVDAHGSRDAWWCVFEYTPDLTTQPVNQREPTKVTGIWIAQLTAADFRHNPRGVLGTRTASPNRDGVAKLRANCVYRGT